VSRVLSRLSIFSSRSLGFSLILSLFRILSRLIIDSSVIFILNSRSFAFVSSPFVFLTESPGSSPLSPSPSVSRPFLFSILGFPRSLIKIFVLAFHPSNCFLQTDRRYILPPNLKTFYIVLAQSTPAFRLIYSSTSIRNKISYGTLLPQQSPPPNLFLFIVRRLVIRHAIFSDFHFLYTRL